VDFAHTWSCYKGGDVHCGKCGTCVERREAFQQAGLVDPTTYAATPPLPSAPRSDQLSAFSDQPSPSHHPKTDS